MSDASAGGAVTVVETRNLAKHFCDFWGRPRVTAVDGLNLAIRRGEVFALLGPNGSGKSTTIKMLLDLLRPTRGQITVLGQPPGDVATKARIGYLPEESHLYPYLSGQETLLFFARLFDLSGAEQRERVSQLLDMVGLDEARYRRVGEYSKGMQRRLGLAQALLNDPDLIILDEPTAGLDPLGMREVKDLLRHLARRGKTVLLCSHLLAEVEDVCDRVHILYQGRTIAEGTLDELLAEPEQVQLQLPALGEAALAQVLTAIERTAGPGTVVAQTPHRSLESFFIDQVHRASGAQPATQPLEPLVAYTAPLPAPEPEPAPEAEADEAAEPAGDTPAPAAPESPADGPPAETPDE